MGYVIKCFIIEITKFRPFFKIEAKELMVVSCNGDSEFIKALFRSRIKFFWVSHRMCRKDVGKDF